jgi:acyl-CoA synthetase (AMP-forming)/AMP-acid ligase II
MGENTALAAESFCDVVRDHARVQGDVIAFTYAGEEISFAELDEGANRAANGLSALGVKPGERVAFLGKNHPLYFEAFLGAARIGAVMTPVNWRLAAPEVAYILDNCQARVVFIGEGFAEVLSGIRADCPRLEQVIGIDAPDFAGTDYRTWRDGFPATPPAHRVRAEDDALQLYTSGTTGKPKGAVMTPHGFDPLQPRCDGRRRRDAQLAGADPGRCHAARHAVFPHQRHRHGHRHDGRGDQFDCPAGI